MVLMRKFCECYSLKSGFLIIGIFNMLVPGGLICDYLFQLPGQINAFRRLGTYPKKNLDLLKLNMDIAIWVLAGDVLMVVFMMMPLSCTFSFTPLKTRRCVRVVLIPCIVGKCLPILHGLTAIVWLPLVFSTHCWEIVGIMIAIGLHILLGMYLVIIAISYYQELGMHGYRETTMKRYTRQQAQGEQITTGEDRIPRQAYQREAMTDDEFESILTEASEQRRSEEKKNRREKSTDDKHNGIHDKYREKHISVSEDEPEMETTKHYKVDQTERRETRQPKKRTPREEDLDAVDGDHRNRRPRVHEAPRYQHGEERRGSKDKRQRAPSEARYQEPELAKSPAKTRYAKHYRNDAQFEDDNGYDDKPDYLHKPPQYRQETEDYSVFTDV